MSRRIRTLIAEDNPADAELILRELRRAGFEVDSHRVDTEAEFLRNLHPELDVILSDYAMPQFGGLRALELVNERALDVPFILISGTIGEEIAVAAMKQGAADYLLKDRLTRLGQSVEHALEQKRLRDERKHAEEELRVTDEQLRHLLAHSPAVIYTLKIDGQNVAPVVVSENIERLLGFSMAESTRYEWWLNSLHPEDRDRVLDGLARGLTKDGFYMEYRVRHKDGTYHWVEDVNRVVRDAKGEAKEAVGVWTDVTERKRAEERLREQADIINRAQDAIIIRNFEDRQIAFWNSGAERLYGWSAAEVVGRVEESIFADPQQIETMMKTLASTGEFHGEIKQRTKGGEKLVTEGRATLVRHPDGTPRSVLLICTDVTEQKKLEMQLLRAQRLESIGTLASGVAHDLNNILTPILVCAQSLGGGAAAKDVPLLASLIEQSAKRGASIVKQVLTFARGVEGERVLIKPTHLIEEMIDIARKTFPKLIEIKSRYRDDVWSIEADPTQLHQVLLNLCVNARDAMTDGGSLSIAAENFTVAEDFVSHTPDAKPGPYVLLSVSDTGSGMPQATIDKIFDPFFTTKAIGKGTGLGLSTSLGIVKSHGGFILVESETGRGTTFKIFLPAQLKEITQESEATPESLKGNGELILLVDDEASILHVTKMALENKNYRVVSAADGREALKIFSEQSSAINAILTDIGLPYMNGEALAREIKKIKPDAILVASTGQGDLADVAELQALGVVNFLTKPYDSPKLLETLRDALEGKPSVVPEVS